MSEEKPHEEVDSGKAKHSVNAEAENLADYSESSKGQPAHSKPDKKKLLPRGALVGIVVAVIAVIAVVCACVFAFAIPAPVAEPELQVEKQVEEAVPEEDVELLPESPVDWKEWQNLNDNVYAWVSVPDTGIELPVLQHPVAENYYLEHDIYGNSTIAGAIYSQKTYNSKDFQDDPVTVLYGHTFETNDTMFTKLHMLEDEVFFDEHPYFYIYTPEYNLTYEIISAYEWDNKLILAKYDVHNLDVQQEYFDIVSDPESTNKNVRAMDRLIAGEDHIVQLSTCTIPSNSNKRYLVTGVLVSAERVQSTGDMISEADAILQQQNARDEQSAE